MKMRMTAVTALGCAVLGGVTALAGVGPKGDGGLRNTPHDFSQYSWQFDPGGGVNQGQICVPCHTPHNANPYNDANGALLPLWNHKLNSGSAYTLSTWAGPGAANLSYRSLLCLGCHDGVTALDSYGYQDGGVGSPAVRGGHTGTTVMDPLSSAVIGTDLRDDHPIGIYYPVSFTNNTSTSWGTLGATSFGGSRKINEIHTSTSDTNTVNAVRVYPTSTSGADGNYTVECESCHQPHNDRYGDFLRFANNDPANPSALCVTCHVSKW
jgi:hypothetical protein